MNGTGPWPSTATRDPDGGLVIGGVPVRRLADEYGTPLWVVDEHDLRERCRRWRAAFADGVVCYAAKAWCTTAILQIVVAEGLWVDVASGGELATALAAGIDPQRLVFHGNNKSPQELERAVEVGVGRVVIDSTSEMRRLEAIAAARGTRVRCWLRITPGIDAHTHHYVRTGHDDSKFGFSLSLGLADAAVAELARHPHLEVVGLHAHIGSQIFGTEPFLANVEALVGAAARWRDAHGLECTELDIGGGAAIAYTHEDRPLEVERLAAEVRHTLADACAAAGLPPPLLVVEPGRAIVGPSTVTVYTVGTIKDLPGLRTYVSVDGGMSDNIRPALYGAEHEVTLANRRGAERSRPFTVVGKHCESGDLVREHAPLPEDLAEGDLLAVAATGAYTESMASNYNRLPRPAAVLVADGRSRLILRRETDADLLARDLPLEDGGG